MYCTGQLYIRLISAYCMSEWQYHYISRAYAKHPLYDHSLRYIPLCVMLDTCTFKNPDLVRITPKRSPTRMRMLASPPPPLSSHAARLQYLILHDHSARSPGGAQRRYACDHDDLIDTIPASGCSSYSLVSPLVGWQWTASVARQTVALQYVITRDSHVADTRTRPPS